MPSPKISVVTISYNQGQFLEETIQSVLSQNYDNLEYIIIDGGSTDNSVDIIKKYEDQLHFWCSEKDNGPASALNKGFAKATGNIYFYLNSDDVLLPGAFDKVLKFMTVHPGFDLYYGHAHLLQNGTKTKIFSDLWDLNRYRLILVGIVQQTTFFRASIFKKVGGFNESNRFQWDGELLVDFALAKGKFIRYNFCTALFRIHEASISGGAGDDEGWEKYRRALGEKINQQIKPMAIPRPLILLSKFILDPYVMFNRFLPNKVK